MATKTYTAQSIKDVDGPTLKKLAHGRQAQHKALARHEAQRRIDNGSTSRWPYEALDLVKPQHTHAKGTKTSKKSTSSKTTTTRRTSTTAPKAAVVSGKKVEANLAFQLALAEAPDGHKRRAAGKAYKAIMEGKSQDEALEIARQETARRIAEKATA
jgi:hypothetical protein